MTTKRTKYRAVPIEISGVRYASKAKAIRATALELLKRAGKVDWWLRQVPVDIREPGVDRPVRVDFLVSMGGQVHAEYVKDVETASFRRHVRQWRLRGPFPLHVIIGKITEIVEGADKT